MLRARPRARSRSRGKPANGPDSGFGIKDLIRPVHVDLGSILSYDEVASGELGRQAKGESAEVSGSPRRATNESQRNQADARVSGVSDLGCISLLMIRHMTTHSR
jgi:hypothetical protein